MSLARLLSALASGLVFGFGLSISGMLDPVRVRGFLDVTGHWDPSLMAVLGGAVTVAAIGFLILRRLAHPAFDTQFEVPTNRRIDPPLVIGAALFGIGWGLAGFCPGPAVSALSTGAVPVVVFVAAMLSGMTLHDGIARRKP